MKLPKELNTVTPASRLLAFILFIELPIVGFILGMRHQQVISTPAIAIYYPTPAIDEAANPDSIGANWKMYTNSKYKYSVKYPPDWDVENVDIANPEVVNFLKEPSRKGIDMHSRAVSIKAEPNPQGNIPTIEWYKTEWATQIPAGINFNAVKFEETTFQGLPALKANSTIFFTRGSYMFSADWGVIDFGNADPKMVELTKQTFDQILSTFKFTDQTQVTPTETVEGKFCGGIAGLACPGGYKCQLDGKYPDAGGKCFKL